MKLSPLLLQSITARLHNAIGVDPATLDAHRLQWIVQSRCRHLALPDASAYASYLAAHPEELGALIDEVVVRETRFFRDPVVFDHIQQTIAHLAATGNTPLRLLSAPCSTGEEAYSLSALMQLMSIPPSRYTVDALDISATALETAHAATYPQRALSHVPPELQRACAQLTADQWLVHDEVRAPVNFLRCNLAEPGALGLTPQYHLILCRNLFIYLAPGARATLAESLRSVLLPGGKLYLGTADHTEEISRLFTPVRPAASFAFTHRARARTPSRPPTPRSTAVPAAPTQSIAPNTATAPIPQPAAQAAAVALLQRALDSRHRGDLIRAESRCRQALYLAPDLLPALELLQTLWTEHPSLRVRRALRNRVLRHQLAAAATEEGA